jgi:ubiquitin carboxyl-terminal hydrolase 12/46
VLQALYFCRPFRERVLSYKEEHQAEETDKGEERGGEADSLLSVLGDLFVQIATYKKKFGVIHPKKFISKVKKENS